MSGEVQPEILGATTADAWSPESSGPAPGGPHTHQWQLRSVEFEDGVEVSRFDCGGCGEVLFR